MTISRADLLKTSPFSAMPPGFPAFSNQLDVNALLNAFLNNEDNKTNCSLGYYSRIHSKVTCYQSKTNKDEAYAIVSSKFLPSRVFKIDASGKAKGVFDDETPIGSLAKFSDALADSDKLVGALSDAAYNVINNPLKSLPSGESHLPYETEVVNDFSFLVRNGSPALLSLVGEIGDAKKSGNDQLLREVGYEIASIVNSKKDNLTKQIKKIEADYDSASLSLGTP